MSPEVKQCQNCKTPFTIEPDDFAFYEKIKVPPPTWCPECRMIRRFVFRNERHLFRRKDDVTGEEIFSGFSPQVQEKVYERDYWWSDAWDPMDYGREYDFSRPFFDQFRELMHDVPRPSRNIVNLINSDYSNQAGYLKNCYLCFDLNRAEDSAYLVHSYDQKDCFDVTDSMRGELNYDDLAVNDCFRTMFSYGCEGCHNLWFSRNCTGCSDCFGCTNLRRKQYHIFNRPYTKEAYFEELKRLGLGSFSALTRLQEKVGKAWLGAPYRFMLGWHNVSVTGDWIANSKNVRDSFRVADAEDSRFCQGLVNGVRDSYDFTVWGNECERIYEGTEIGMKCRDVRFSLNCWPAVQDVEYSAECHSCASLFGCVGLKKKSYCIFNKQYSKEEYLALREKVIQHMNSMPYTDTQGKIYRYGEFFPPEFSPFAYNETIAQDFFPLAREKALREGYLWRDPEAREYQTTIDAADLPDHIRDVQDSILKEIIKCASCGKAYLIIQMELEFLRRMSLPLPRLCVDCRFLERIKHRNAPRFHHRKCKCAGRADDNGIYQNQTAHFHGSPHCPNEFETSYAPERPEIVYCEQCYQAEVV